MRPRARRLALGGLVIALGALAPGCSPTGVEIPAAPAETVWQLYLLGGQSNMDGYGSVEELEPALREPMTDVMIFHGNTARDGELADGRGMWEPLDPGHGAGFASDGATVTHSARFGLELSFARRLRELEPGAHIAIVKYSRGGTSIDEEAAADFGSWDPDGFPGEGVNQLGHAMATIIRAFEAGDIDGDGTPDRLQPAGILWMQGESDAAFTPEIARRYEENLARVITMLRTALGADDLPVAIGRISDSGQDDDGKVWDQGEIVREAQAAFVQADGRAALITSTDEYAYSDPWHYDSAGFLDLGARFADAIRGLNAGR